MNKLIIAISLLWLSTSAQAYQIVEPVKGQNSFVKISAKETTRIFIDGGAIVTLYHIEGELVVEKDDEHGQLFIRPAIPDKPINVRLLSASGATYNLVMQPVDIPQEDIGIREPFDSRTGSIGNVGSSDSHIQSIRSMLNAMASDEPSRAVDRRETRKEYSLWENVQFVLVAVYRDRNLTGEKFVLTNTGVSSLRLVEQELYRQGVIAIAIENMQLEPGQSTYVYVVRSN